MGIIMPWHKTANHNECPTTKPWAVVKDSDNSVAGCHATSSDADKQLAALYANEKDMVAQFEAGNPEALINWYNDGADGQIDWGEPGDFEQCVAVAGDHLDDPEGFCQNRHMDATGEPAGKGAHGGASMKTKQFAAKLDDNKHADIQSAVADAHGIKPDAVASSDDGSNLTVVSKHDDKSTTTTNHALDDNGAVTDSSGADDNEPEAEKVQINAVKAVVGKPSDSETKPKAPPFGKAASAKVTWQGTTANGEPISVIDDQSGPGVQDNAFSMPIMVIEGAWTGDGRFINPGSLSWRDLPLPVMALTETTMSHDGAKLVGRIDSIERRDMTEDDFDSRLETPFEPGTTCLFANGTFDTAEHAQEISRLVMEGFLRGVSVDIGDVTSELVYLDENGNETEPDELDLFDILFGFTADADTDVEDPDGDTDVPSVTTIGERILSGRIMGATICPFPAFEGAYIVVGAQPLTAAGQVIMPIHVGYTGERMPSMRLVDKAGQRQLPKGLVASSAPMAPPSSWFEDPGLDGPTALTITKDGEIFGHLATWTECHMSYTNQCIKAPHSMTDYSYFRTGCVLCDDDVLVPTGTITMNTGHAELWEGSETAKAHYDNTGTVAADIAAGDDAHGIWVHGCMRPDIDDLSVRRLRGAALSGDWRSIGGGLELVAALAVNVPGFPVVRPTARIASGGPHSLVAAGRITQADAKRLASRPTRSVVKQHVDDPETKIVKQFIRDNLRAKVHGH
jgi:hypothetical protein